MNNPKAFGEKDAMLNYYSGNIHSMYCVYHKAGSEITKWYFLITKKSVCPLPPSSIGFKPSRCTGHQHTRGALAQSFTEHTFEMRVIETIGVTKTSETNTTIWYT